nr:vWA domain-containing protein [uncultured Niameybacter sp.]
MGLLSATKTVTPNHISCDGTSRITLALRAEPGLAIPMDIMLVLDQSGSMRNRMPDLKAAAKAFVATIANASNNLPPETDPPASPIAGGTKIGIVKFASGATVAQGLTDNVSALNSAINGLSAGGNTNHEAAFELAHTEVNKGSNSRKIIIMFTDGVTTAGANPYSTQDIRDDGITIYCIGLTGTGGVDVNALIAWAGTSANVVVSNNVADLEKLFIQIANTLTRPHPTKIKVIDIVSPDFQILDVDGNPSTSDPRITINQTDNTVTWEITELGKDKVEIAYLYIDIQHDPNTGEGTKHANTSISYQDDQIKTPDYTIFQVDDQIVVTCCPFPNPEVIEYYPVTPIEELNACEDEITIDVGDTYFESLGHFINIFVNLKEVCPYRQVAVGIELIETDAQGNSLSNGYHAIKVLTISQTSGRCKDVQVGCVKFAVPGAKTTSPTPCPVRYFRARVITNYIGTVNNCCPPIFTPPAVISAL